MGGVVAVLVVALVVFWLRKRRRQTEIPHRQNEPEKTAAELCDGTVRPELWGKERKGLYESAGSHVYEMPGSRNELP